MNILDFFGFKIPPFISVEAGGFFYAFSTQSKVMARVLSFLNGEKGILFLTGAKGTGKTTIVKRSIDYVPLGTRKLIYINMPSGSGVDWLFRRLKKVTGAEGSISNMASLFDIVIIDKFEMANNKSKIEQELSSSSATVLLITRDKVTGNNAIELEPPPASELKKYLQSYLNFAGSSGDLFNEDAVDMIIDLSIGDIELLNKIAWNSLYMAYLSSSHQVTQKEVEVASMELLEVAEESEVGEKEIISEEFTEEKEEKERDIMEEFSDGVTEEVEEAEGTSAELESLLKELEGEGEEAEVEMKENVEDEISEEAFSEESSIEENLEEGIDVDENLSMEDLGDTEEEKEIEVELDAGEDGVEVELDEAEGGEEIEDLLNQLDNESEESETSKDSDGIEEFEVEPEEEELHEETSSETEEGEEVDVDSLLEELGVSEEDNIDDAIEVEGIVEEEPEETIEMAESVEEEENLESILSEFEEGGESIGSEDRLKEYEDEEVDELFKEITVEDTGKSEEKKKKKEKKKGEDEIEDEELKKLLEDIDLDDI